MAVIINPPEQVTETVPPSPAEKQGVDWDETKDNIAIINTLNNSWLFLKFIVRIIVVQQEMTPRFT